MGLNSESGIRWILVGVFLVATITGLNIIFQGIKGIPEPGLLSQASVDNELRFMSVFWVAFGVYCFSASRDVMKNQKNIMYVAIVFFCSGIARLLSYFLAGAPISLFIGAMVLELSLPLLLFVLLRSLGSNEQKVQQV